jgi:hypothetical protein
MRRITINIIRIIMSSSITGITIGSNCSGISSDDLRESGR